MMAGHWGATGSSNRLRGRMGVVYRALDARLSDDVAVKVPAFGRAESMKPAAPFPVKRRWLFQALDQYLCITT